MERPSYVEAAGIGKNSRTETYGQGISIRNMINSLMKRIVEKAVQVTGKRRTVVEAEGV
jgi:hypothetical protein